MSWNNQQIEKTFKKLLTNKIESGKIIKLSQRRQPKIHWSDESKKFWRNFKKPLDKIEEKWYNRQAHVKKVGDWNLTIEQQIKEVQSKFSKCEYKICQNQEKILLLKK